MTPQIIAMNVAHSLANEYNNYNGPDDKYWIEDFKVNEEHLATDYHWMFDVTDIGATDKDDIEGIERGLATLNEWWNGDDEYSEWFWSLVKQSALGIITNNSINFLTDHTDYEVRM